MKSGAVLLMKLNIKYTEQEYHDHFAVSLSFDLFYIDFICYPIPLSSEVKGVPMKSTTTLLFR